MRFAESLMHNLQQFDRQGECRNLRDCLALQTQIVRENMQALYFKVRSVLRANHTDGTRSTISLPSTNFLHRC